MGGSWLIVGEWCRWWGEVGGVPGYAFGDAEFVDVAICGLTKSPVVAYA